MARVQVSDETWTEYRATLGTTPVSVGLGRLVEREVARDRRRTAVDTAGLHDAVGMLARLPESSPRSSRGLNRPRSRQAKAGGTCRELRHCSNSS